MKRHYSLQIALACLFISSIVGSAVLPDSIFREPVRVSVGVTGNEGDNDSDSSGGGNNHFSADGRYLVFSSRAANISNDDADTLSDIHVYDRQSRTLQLISRAGALGAKGNNDSLAPAMSLDGRFVAFSSKASNLDSDDADSISDIYVFDRKLGSVELISRSGATGEKGNQDSTDAALSGDGRYVAFASNASNLDEGDKDTLSDIYVYDRGTATLEWVSRAGASGIKGNGESYRPAISADGRYVAFISNASNLGSDNADNGPGIFVYDRHSGSVRAVSRIGTDDTDEDKNLAGPSISADGRYVSYSSRTSGPFADVFVYDLQTGTEELVSRAGAGELKANGDSVDPAISADGRYVTFTSFADNLGDGDTDALPDIHVYDRQHRVLHWLSRPAGESGELAGFTFPAPSADSTLLAFSAYSGNTKGAPCCLQVFVKETGLEASNLNIVSAPEANLDAKPAGAASLTATPDFTSSLFTAESVSASTVAGYEPSRDVSRSNVSLNGSPRPRTYWGAVSDDSDNTWVDTSFRASQANVTFGYPDVGALNNGQVTVRYRFRAGTSSNSNVAVTVTLLNGSITLGTSLARTLTEGSAAFEYSESFTGITISSGANLQTKFSWTRTASNQPAQLKEVDIDVDTGGACTPETDAEFCARLAKNCGQVTGTDNCGSSRTVSSCGACTSPETCSTSNICTIPNPTTPGSF